MVRPYILQLYFKYTYSRHVPGNCFVCKCKQFAALIVYAFVGVNLCKAAVSWKFGHYSAQVSLKIWWIITHEHQLFDKKQKFSFIL